MDEKKQGVAIIAVGIQRLSQLEMYNNYWLPLKGLPEMDGKLQLTGDHLKYYNIYTDAVAAAKSELTDGQVSARG